MTSALPPSNEQALIEASRAGDSAALEEPVRAHQTRVYNFAMRMCRNIEDAKDILQETFLGMLRSIRDFRRESRFTTWLYRIASNACSRSAGGASMTRSRSQRSIVTQTEEAP